ncbi:hypothetical protein [Flavobacterium sp. 2]|uniref:hypothetical protein n=1 Tax=Flavobacterium sp. 2 TaxID=308053 RepID=UPI003CF118DE
MKNLKIQQGKSYCEKSHAIIYTGYNNELIFRKVYQGDWGDWDEEPENDSKYNNPELQSDYKSFNADV